MIIKHLPISKEIEALYWDRKFDEIGKLPGFKIIERRDTVKDEKENFDCLKWIFANDRQKTNHWVNNRTDHGIPVGYERVKVPKKEDLIEYYMEIGEIMIPQHIGRYVGNERIQSKFRMSHVYEHPLNALPIFYGNTVKFFRKI